MRNIVLANMPYDTGFMFLEGASFYETNAFLLCRYEITRVPYIVYQEDGFEHYITKKMVTKNQGFIRDKTVGDLNRHASYKQAGLVAPPETLGDRVKRRGSLDMVKQGALEKVRSGYRADHF